MLSIQNITTKQALDKINATSSTSIIGQFAMLVIISFLLFGKITLFDSVLIFLYHIIFLTLRYYIRYQYTKQKDFITTSKTINYWFSFYKLSLFLSGIAWGVIFLFLFDVAVEFHFIIAGIIFGIAAVGLFTLGANPQLYLSFILPMLSLSSLWMLLQNDITHIISALLLILGGFYYIRIAYSNAENFNQAILEKNKAHEYMEEVEKERFAFETIFEKSLDGVLIIKDNKFIQCNEKVVKILACTSKDDILNKHPSSFSPEYQSDGQKSYDKAEEMMNFAMTYGSHKFEWLHTKDNGVNFWAEITLNLITLHNDKVLHVILRDISERKEAEIKLLHQKNELHYIAHHDALTGLPNRLLFNDRFETSIKNAKKEKGKLALFFLDLDNFKKINDSLGHDTGDKVLKIATQRLHKILGNENTISRLGGDEFTIIMKELVIGESSRQTAQRILQTLQQAIIIDGHSLYVSCSIGISIYPNDAKTTQELLKYADSAMYKAKSEGRNNFQYYSTEMTELAIERVIMEANFRESLKNENFVVYYQAQVNAKTNQLIGMEALVRWNHPNVGIISPAKFLPLAESIGLIVELDRFVMRDAMNQFTNWYKEGLNPGKLALNLSMEQLEQEDFISMFKILLKETKCKAQWIELEVTESKIMTNPEKAIKILEQISDMGIELAIDDFGTGYSSLSYLKKLPIDKLKIDQSFIRELPYDDEDAGITKAVIALAKSLNLKIIAEGVETINQKDFLVQNGCENIQGYLYCKPIPSDKMKIILTEGLTF